MPASQTVSPTARPDMGGLDEFRTIIAAHLGREGPLLPILHDLQAAYGCIPSAARPEIAEALNITQAELHGVISFYHDFREAPAGRHVLKICRSEACQSMGGEAMAARVLEWLGLGWGETSADGRITVEPVYCLGLCACAPAAMVNGKLKGRAEAQTLLAEVSA